MSSMDLDIDKTPNPSAKTAPQSESNLDGDKKIGIALFILDGILVVAAVTMFATMPSCNEGEADFTDGAADYSSFGSVSYSSSYNSYGSSSSGSSGSYGSSSYGTSYNSHTSQNQGAQVMNAGPEVTNYPYFDVVEIIQDDIFHNKNFECGVQAIKPDLSQKGRVVGGTIAVPHSWPWIVRIAIGGGEWWSERCGGTIVSPKHIVTALHCFDELGEEHWVSRYKALIAKHDKTNTPGDSYMFAKVRKHPESSKMKLYYDLVLMTVKKTIEFSDKVQPACLPELDAIPAGGTTCWAYGWGATKGTGGDNFLKQVDLDIIVGDDCPHIVGVYICAGGLEGKDTCQGDSGGPLTCQENGKWVLHGATSFGRGCGDGHVGVYAAIATAVEWLCCFMADIPSCKNIDCDPGIYY